MSKPQLPDELLNIKLLAEQLQNSDSYTELGCVMNIAEEALKALGEDVT